MSGKATVLISHDDDYYRDADRSIKFDCGKIVSHVDAQPEMPPVAQ